MMDIVANVLEERNSPSHHNQGILVAKVATPHIGLLLVNDILKRIVDTTTLLLLSGGKTPWQLYKTIALEEEIIPGAVGLVDERFGEKYHAKSNERKLRETGLLRYLEIRDIPFYPIISSHPEQREVALLNNLEILRGAHNDKTREETAEEYDIKLRELFHQYRKSIALLGIGFDGHTAGMAGNRPDFTNPIFAPERRNMVVSEFYDPKGKFHERVTMTFLGLEHMDLLIILVFGEDKIKAVQEVFTEGDEAEVPGRFYKRPEIAKKTLFITDLNI